MNIENIKKKYDKQSNVLVFPISLYHLIFKWFNPVWMYETKKNS